VGADVTLLLVTAMIDTKGI